MDYGKKPKKKVEIGVTTPLSEFEKFITKKDKADTGYFRKPVKKDESS